MKPEIKKAVHSGEINLSDAIALHKMPTNRQITILKRAIDEEWSHRKFVTELRYWKNHPFQDYWNEQSIKRADGRYHAFSFVNHPGTKARFESFWEKFGKSMGLPNPYSCETTITIPAMNAEYVCPKEVNWVVASYRTIEPSMQVEFFEGKPMGVEWIFLCEDCAKIMFPMVEYHPEIGFPELPIEDIEFFSETMPQRIFF
jgi:hypothetical protein